MTPKSVWLIHLLAHHCKVNCPALVYGCKGSGAGSLFQQPSSLYAKERAAATDDRDARDAETLLLAEALEAETLDCEALLELLAAATEAERRDTEEETLARDADCRLLACNGLVWGSYGVEATWTYCTL